MKETSSTVSRISDKAIVDELSGKVFSASRQRMPIIIAFFYYIFKSMLAVGAYISKSFLRVRLGERSFGFLTIIMVYVLLFLTALIYDIKPQAEIYLEEAMVHFEQEDQTDMVAALIIIVNDQENSNRLWQATLLGIYILSKDFLVSGDYLSKDLELLWWVTIICSLMHLIERIIRKRNGVIIHSYYRGDSIFFSFLEDMPIGGLFTLKKNHIWMFLDPLLVFVIAYIVGNFFEAKFASIVLYISSICLFLEECRVHIENKNMLLDIVDSQIDGSRLASVQEEYATKLAQNQQVQNQDSGTTPIAD